ncbi:MAG: ROK family protein [Acidimicrobiales bacterium]|nr:ROK family protein [Acidimicrobiales bacterium]
MTPTILAIDIGGTKLEVGLVGADDGRILTRHRIATPSVGDGEELLATVFDLAQATLDDDAGEPPQSCGVGCGGPMRMAERLVSPLNIAQWRDFPLAQRLEQRFGLVTHVDNDAKALALGEGWRGAAAGCPNYLAMVVSTGVGAGIVLEGRLLDGADGNAGHIGHLIVNPGGREHAGIRGSLEGEASGTAIAALTSAPAAAADDTWRRRTGTLVGRAVGGVANLLDLKLAVVAGSVALGFGDDFFHAAQAEVDRVALLDHSLGTRIVPAGLGPDGPLVGAAAVSLYRRGLLHLG